jgi:hypothetical protein
LWKRALLTRNLKGKGKKVVGKKLSGNAISGKAILMVNFIDAQVASSGLDEVEAASGVLALQLRAMISARWVFAPAAGHAGGTACSKCPLRVGSRR